MMLGARTAAWAKSGGLVNPYVTDGLIAWWDGEWNVGLGQHEDSPEYWTNLATGEQDIKINGATFADKWLVGGTISNILTNYSNAYHTSEYAVYLVNQDERAYFRPDTNYAMGSLSFRNYGGNHTIVYGVWDGGTKYVTSQRISPTLDNDHVIQMTFPDNTDPSTLSVLVDGLSHAVTPTVGYVNRTNGTTVSPPENGKIYAIRLYDRILTESELAKNRSVDVARFGIELET